MSERPAPIKKTSKGTQLWGPAGAGVWSSPTVDLKRRAVYVATGNAYTEPAAPGSDAVIAFDLDTGKRLWISQVMANDSYVAIARANTARWCRKTTSLKPARTSSDPTWISQRADPADACRRAHADCDWTERRPRVGARPRPPGGGGLEAVSSSSASTAAARDHVAQPPTIGSAILSVTRATTTLGSRGRATHDREIVWRASPPDVGRRRWVIPGVVFFGSERGTLYAYSTTEGRRCGSSTPAREFATVNGVPRGAGQSMPQAPVAAGGMIFMTSGYSELGNGARGNGLAFGVAK